MVVNLCSKALFLFVSKQISCLLWKAGEALGLHRRQVLLLDGAAVPACFTGGINGDKVTHSCGRAGWEGAAQRVVIALAQPIAPTAQIVQVLKEQVLCNFSFLNLSSFLTAAAAAAEN